MNVFKILVAFSAMGVLVFAAGPVMKTGQTTIYVDYDDGYYQSGVPRSYSRSGNVVIDNMTGLQWQDNESIRKQWVTPANYDVGSYSNTLGDTATTYCANLTLDGGGWRLPSIEEFETIVDEGEHSPSLSEGLFLFYKTSTYWSSATDVSSTDSAWGHDFFSRLFGQL